MPHNSLVPPLQPITLFAAALAMGPYLAAGFFPARVAGAAQRMPIWMQVASPSLLCVPYLLVSSCHGNFAVGWFALYALLPAALAAALCHANQRQTQAIWVEFLILAGLGLVVDLRCFESAWPPHLAVFNKILLLDAGIYAFAALRPMAGAGFDLRLSCRDLATGPREFTLYLPIALALGLGLGFLHWQGVGAHPLAFIGRLGRAWAFTFFFIAVPEELFFRGWLQNLLERRIGRLAALLLTAALFGLAHFNKRAEHFNGRYVLMAAIAGIFYGRAWRNERRVGASAITHATVDAVWSLWLR